MGRLLRTKKTEKKRKPGEGGDPAPLTGEEAAEVTEAPAAAAPAQDTQKKKPPVPQKKPVTLLPIKIGYLEKGLQFLREAKAELKKVTWPSKKQTIGSTAVVIVLVVIISLFLGLVDMTLSSLMHIVLQ